VPRRLSLPARITPVTPIARRAVATVTPLAGWTIAPVAAIAPAPAATAPTTTTPAFISGVAAGGSAARLFALGRPELAALLTGVVETAAARPRPIGRTFETTLAVVTGALPVAVARWTAIHRRRRARRLAFASLAVPAAPAATPATPTTAPPLAPLASLSPTGRTAFIAPTRHRTLGALAIVRLELARVRLTFA